MTIIVTGASSGIGRSICELLLKDSIKVIGISRDPSKAGIDHPNFKGIAQDFLDVESLTLTLQKICKTTPDLEGIIFSAGKGLFGALEQFSNTQIQEVMQLNFTSIAIATKTVLPYFKTKRTGTLIFIGSEAALQGKAQGSIYCASKFALRGFTQAIREECSKANVRVCLINPGIVKTPFFDSLHFSPKEDPNAYCLPEDIALIATHQLKVRGALVLEEVNIQPLKKHIVLKNKTGAAGLSGPNCNSALNPS